MVARMDHAKKSATEVQLYQTIVQYVVLWVQYALPLDHKDSELLFL